MDVSVLTNSAIAAKIKAMRGKLLSKAQYDGLVKCENVTEIAEYLKQNSVYTDVDKIAQQSSIHRGALELYLTGTAIDDYEKLYRFSDSERKALLDVIFSNYEISAIIKVARRLYTGSSASAELGNFLKRHIDINIESLAKAENIENLTELLVNTEYYNPLKSLLKLNKNVTIFDVEMALDILYYKKIMQFAGKIKKKSDKLLFTRFYGSLIDILNIRCIHRCKTNFNLDSEYIYSYIIPYNYKISKDTIIKMANAPSKEQLSALIEETPYNEMFRGNSFAIEYERFFERLSSSILLQHPYSIVCLSCYFKLKEIENFNLTSIIEGIRYSLDKDEIQELIIA